MGYPNVTVGWLLVHELHTAAICKSVVVLDRCTAFCGLQVFTIWVQTQQDVPPLNEISEALMIWPWKYEVAFEIACSHGNQVFVGDTCRQRVLTHMSWNSEGGGRPHQAHYWSSQRNQSPSQSQISNPHLCQRGLQLAEQGGAGSQGWSGNCWNLYMGPRALESCLSMFSWELVVTPVSQQHWHWALHHPGGWLTPQMAGRLVQIAVRFATFLPMLARALHFEEGGPSCSENRGRENTLVKTRTNREEYG